MYESNGMVMFMPAQRGLCFFAMVVTTSVAVGKDNTLYVSNKGTLAGAGEVLRIRPAS